MKGRRSFVTLFGAFGYTPRTKATFPTVNTLINTVNINILIATVVRNSTTAATVIVSLTTTGILGLRATVTVALNSGVNAAMATRLTSVATGHLTGRATLTRALFGYVNILVITLAFCIPIDRARALFVCYIS